MNADLTAMLEARSPARPRTYLVNPRYTDIGGAPCFLPSPARARPGS
jgi:hypothetical protein